MRDVTAADEESKRTMLRSLPNALESTEVECAGPMIKGSEDPLHAFCESEPLQLTRPLAELSSLAATARVVPYGAI